jgi:exodeoxyribonuclease V alpha subunit
MAEKISGVIERVVHYDRATAFCIAEVRESSGALLKLVTHCPPLESGDEIEAEGHRENHRRYGVQFRAERVQPLLPVTRAAIQRYLGSGRLRGIGPALARRLVEKFGENVVSVLDDAPDQLLEVHGIGAKKLAEIKRNWEDQRGVWRLAAMLGAHGVGTRRAQRIHKQYGSSAVSIIRENPYRLAQEVRGIGFETADAIAQSLGFDRASPFRIAAGLQHLLDESRTQGNCGHPHEELVRKAAELLGCTAELVQSVLSEAIARTDVIAEEVGGTVVVFTRRLHAAETNIARRLLELAAAKGLVGSKELEEIVRALELPEEKRDAIRRTLTSGVSVITGGPGVGKTTVVRTILEILTARELSFELAAPTGRAAKRLMQQTGAGARTIHRLLEWHPEAESFQRNEDDPLKCDLLVIDEASMADVLLFESVLRAVGRGTSLLIVGDADQLPSIGPGQVLRDVIASGRIPVSALRTVYRQGNDSRIIDNAHAINRGEMPDLTNPAGTDFFFWRASDAEKARDLVLRVVAERTVQRGLDPLRDVQVLAPMHKGFAGVEELNAKLQARLNPSSADGPRIQRGAVWLTRGDKVMQTVNNYDKDVFNGDVGIVREVNAEEDAMSVEFDGFLVEYTGADIDQLTLAYATTVHKAQGSEFPAVVIPIVSAQSIMLQRNLLYTAVTRGQKFVILIGEESAIAKAVRNANATRRWTRLAAVLRAAP